MAEGLTEGLSVQLLATEPDGPRECNTCGKLCNSAADLNDHMKHAHEPDYEIGNPKPGECIRVADVNSAMHLSFEFNWIVFGHWKQFPDILGSFNVPESEVVNVCAYLRLISPHLSQLDRSPEGLQRFLLEYPEFHETYLEFLVMPDLEPEMVKLPSSSPSAQPATSAFTATTTGDESARATREDTGGIQDLGA